MALLCPRAETGIVCAMFAGRPVAGLLYWLCRHRGAATGGGWLRPGGVLTPFE